MKLENIEDKSLSPVEKEVSSDERTVNGHLKLENITDIEIEGINHKDAPDYVDAFICSANWINGQELTDEELDELNSDYRDFVYEQVIKKIY